MSAKTSEGQFKVRNCNNSLHGRSEEVCKVYRVDLIEGELHVGGGTVEVFPLLN